MTPDLAALLEEWFTGRTPDGKESARFARRWRDSRRGNRTYEPHTDDVHPDAELTAALGITGMNVRPALGADGAVDVRVELDRGPAREVFRWRPAIGTLAELHHRGRRHAKSGKVIDAETRALNESMALDHDADSTTLEATHAAIAALKARRFELIDMSQAGSASAAAELLTVESKLAAVRVRHDALNVARRAALFARDAAANEARLIAGEASDPEALARLVADQRAIATRLAAQVQSDELARAARRRGAARG